jgi:hypothetical protein
MFIAPSALNDGEKIASEAEFKLKISRQRRKKAENRTKLG